MDNSDDVVLEFGDGAAFAHAIEETILALGNDSSTLRFALVLANFY